jgi:hypothetical protein
MAISKERGAPVKGLVRRTTVEFVDLPLRTPKNCSVTALKLDLLNPRLQTGEEIDARDEPHLIEILADIAALDELVLSICTNTYLNLEPLIVVGPDGGPFTVVEGNRRLAAIRLIQNPQLARDLNIKIPTPVSPAVLKSIREVLVFRVRTKDDAREFIGFKHINGPQRWDAFAKAKYVTDWYRSAQGAIGIDEIADKMGDANNTLRTYIYAILILDQASNAGVWSLEDRPKARGRFAFSHLYTAITRAEYQQYLGMTDGWSNKPSLRPIKQKFLRNLGEVLTYLYGSVSDDRRSLIKSQNPDLKDLGLVIADPRARIVVQNKGSLETALEELKEPASAFHDALVVAKLRLGRAIDLMVKHSSANSAIDDLIDEIYAQADTLKTMNDKKRPKSKH